MFAKPIFSKLLISFIWVYFSTGTWAIADSHTEKLTDDGIISYAPVADNPAYAAVTKLAFSEADKKITYGEDPNQFGLLWQPKNNPAKNTLVVFIHGGCWISAFDVSHTYAATTAIAQAGYPVWSLEYRRAGETGGGWPTTYEDIKAGVAAIATLPDHGVKFDHVVLAGHSAGGHLALLSGANIKYILPETNLSFSIAGLAAITDLKTYASNDGSCNSGGLKFMGGKPEEKPTEYIKANPVNNLYQIPTTLFQGNKDPIVPVSQAKALTSGTNIKQTFVADAGHFDWVHPGTPAFRKFLDYLTANY